MSDEALKIRVIALEADLFNTKVNLAGANNGIDELKQRFDEKHGIKLTDWIYGLFEHEPGLDMYKKKRLACMSQ